MVDFILQNADRLGGYVLLIILLVGFATGKIVWGWQYDRQVTRTEYFMDLARRYAVLARVGVEAAELLSPPPDGAAGNEPQVQPTKV